MVGTGGALSRISYPTAHLSGPAQHRDCKKLDPGVFPTVLDPISEMELAASGLGLPPRYFQPVRVSQIDAVQVVPRRDIASGPGAFAPRQQINWCPLGVSLPNGHFKELAH